MVPVIPEFMDLNLKVIFGCVVCDSLGCMRWKRKDEKGREEKGEGGGDKRYFLHRTMHQLAQAQRSHQTFILGTHAFKMAAYPGVCLTKGNGGLL